jgi:pyruvate dehydrogenase E1 component
VKHKGQPTVILAKTIKGYGMGEAAKAQNITHQQKKMTSTRCAQFRDRFAHPDPRRQARRAAVLQARRRQRRR